jgi:hypothetical protein
VWRDVHAYSLTLFSLFFSHAPSGPPPPSHPGDNQDCEIEWFHFSCVYVATRFLAVLARAPAVLDSSLFLHIRSLRALLCFLCPAVSSPFLPSSGLDTKPRGKWLCSDCRKKKKKLAHASKEEEEKETTTAAAAPATTKETKEKHKKEKGEKASKEEK